MRLTGYFEIGSRLRGALTGGALGVLAIAVVHFPFRHVSVLLLSLFLTFTACAYLGALLAQAQPSRIVGMELAVGVAVFVCAVLGALVSPAWLAAGYGIHGLWDWAHDAGLVGTRVARWFPPACATFDIMIAGFTVLLIT